MKTMKVMPWGKDQGDFVVINESDFDPKVHKEFKDSAAKAAEPAKETESAPVKAKKAAKGK